MKEDRPPPPQKKIKMYNPKIENYKEDVEKIAEQAVAQSIYAEEEEHNINK
jgi:hypothetical protein